jgi:hypothetical protein
MVFVGIRSRPAVLTFEFRQGRSRTGTPVHQGAAPQGRSNRSSQFTRELNMEMKKLTIKKSRLVELNRGQLAPTLMSVGSLFIACGTCTNTAGAICAPTTTHTGPIAIAVDPYSRRKAA